MSEKSNEQLRAEIYANLLRLRDQERQSVEKFRSRLVAAVREMNTSETGATIDQVKGAAWTKKRVVELIEQFPSEGAS